MDKLERLRAFVRLVERGSFSAVAAELGVGQSTVSKWLASLEDELDARLLDRTTRSHRVTEAGERLYPRARAAVAAYDAALSDDDPGASAWTGRIRLSLPVVFGRMHLVPIVVDFLRAHPGLHLDMSFADHYVNLVEQGFDAAVRVGATVDSSLRSHALGDCARRLVAAPGYLADAGMPRRPDDLTAHECLVHVDGSASTTWRLTKAGGTSRVRVGGRVRASNSAVTRQLALDGFGIAMLASWLVDADLATGRLVQVLPSYRPPRAPIRALTAPGRHLPRHTRALLDALREGLARRLPSDRAGTPRRVS